MDSNENHHVWKAMIMNMYGEHVWIEAIINIYGEQ